MNIRRITLCITAAAIACALAACGDQPVQTTTTDDNSVMIKTEAPTTTAKETKKNKKVHTYTTDDYVKVTMDGASGKARAIVEFDRDTFYDLMNKDLFDGNASDADLASMEMHLYDAVKIMTSETENLSNGDTIEISLSVDNDIISEYGIAFDGSTYSYTVEELEEMREIKPLEDVVVTFYGENGDGRTKIEYVGDDEWVIKNVTFLDSPSHDLSNGDIVEISANSDPIRRLHDGIMIEDENKTMNVEVTGLTE